MTANLLVGSDSGSGPLGRRGDRDLRTTGGPVLGSGI